MEQEETAWTRPPPSGAAVNPHISLTPGIQQQVTTFLTGLAPGETVDARHLTKKLHLPKKLVNQALYSLERSQRAFKQGDLPILWSLHRQPPTNHQEHPNSRPASSDLRPGQSSEDTWPPNAAKTETVKAEERLNKGEAEDLDTDSTSSSTSCSDSSNPDQEAPRRSSDQSANRQLQLATATGQDLHSVPSTSIIMGEQKEQVMQYLLESGEATALVIAKNLGFKNAKQVSPTLYALEKQGDITKNGNMTPPTWELSRHRRERMERSLKASQGNAPTAGKDTSITFKQHPRPLMELQPRPFMDEDDTKGGQWASWDDIPEFLNAIRRDPADELLDEDGVRGRPGTVAVSLAAPPPSEHLGQAAGGASEEPGERAQRERPVPGTEQRVPAPGPVGTLERPMVPHAGDVVLDGRLFPVAEGTSKKVAKNDAAAAMLRILVGENMKPGAGAEEGQDPAMEEVTNPTPENACVDTASASILLSEEQFLCSICLDVFTDPVSTPCGHNYCKTCITHYWDTSNVCKCPLCQTIFCKRPDILVNTLISEMADQFRKFKHSKQLNKTCSTNQEPAETDEVSCDVCTETKLKALKSCLVCLISYCETHLEPHQRVAALKRHKLINPVKNLEDIICKKHDKPLELFCKTDNMCVCQICTQLDHKLHQIVSLKEAYEGKKAELVKTEAEVQQMIQERQEKIQDVTHSVELSKKDADREIADSVQVFTALISCIQRSQAELIDVIEEKQKTTEKQAEGFIKDLQQEITELKKRSSELKQLSHTEDHLHFLHNFHNFPSISTPPPIQVNVHQSSFVETTRTALKTLGQEMEKRLRDAELRRIQQYAVDVTLDPDTAHPNLILSEDGKQVSVGKVKKNLPNNKERFSEHTRVLGKQSFSSGRFYYEVQVKGLTGWTAGVARESINRKQPIAQSPNNGYWSVGFRNGNEYKALTDPLLPLPVTEKVQTVGVFVDYEEGLVSFYDVETRVHLYSFTGCTFTDKLYPILNLNLSGGKNSAPLIITPVNHTD